MVVCYTGGGTLGHVYPALAVHEALKDSLEYEAFFIGRKSMLEEQTVRRSGLDFYRISSGKLRRYRTLRNLIDPLFVLIGFFQALIILIRRRSDVIFSKGGFVTPPVVLAAWLLRIPVISHESDSTPGLATRLNSRFSKVLCVPHLSGFEALRGPVLKITGNPVRKELLTYTPQISDLPFIKEEERLILILGGSAGARQINELVGHGREQLTELGWVYHQCGKGNMTHSTHPRYIEVEFIDDLMAPLLARADVVVSRAGANTLAELALFRSAALLIPLSTRSSRGDQIENAQHLAQQGGARVLFGEVSPQQFIEEISTLLESDEQRRDLSNKISRLAQRESASLIAQIIRERARSSVCSGE